ncbi:MULTISPECIES: thiol reductant ABC exporter subunit CydD [Gemella]|uniref:thiol reductant ABC exporter subunit CydD n=1 Tax=Gemella TaxID=1378 RepID=UPI00076826B7|nr:MULTISPECIES: thiol reductant ABC exporter subunit CydD [Gemella]AME09431.1 cysteine ABC transporter permease [Gemella sp. oral taxon 928]AXI27068.1 thiol reductant ABC exporter subunit CydD [Gemella sp. ND 6198]
MKKKEEKLKLPVKKSLTLTLLVLSTLEAVCIIIQAAFLAKAIVGLFDKNFDNVLRDSILFLMGYIFRTLFLHLEQYVTEKHAIEFEKNLRKELLSSYFNLGPEFTTREGSGKLVTLAIDGIGKVKQYFELNVSKKLRGGIIPALIVIFIFYTDYVSALMIISVIPVIVIFMILLGINARDMANRQYKKYRALSNNFIDTVRGIETLKFLGISKNYLPIMEKKNSEYRQSTMKTLTVAFLNSFALDFLTTIAIALLAVRLGILLLDGSTVLLPSLTVLLIAPEFFLPMKQAATDYHATLDGQMAYEDIHRMIIKNIKNKEEKVNISNVKNISLENISLQKDNKIILNNISLTINKGDRVCLVGQSGSGKTSLISILAGFNNQTTGILRINNEEIKLTDIQWALKISYISQFPYIFPDTIRNNILFYTDENISDKRLEQVCNIVGLDSFINTLPDKYDTLIGEAGQELSGGQAQRVAIARALISDREIIILDEPTSHLDIETEFEIKEKLLELFKERTVIIATHRLHWLNNTDYIVHLDSGKVVDYEKISDFRVSDRYDKLKSNLVGGGYGEK